MEFRSKQLEEAKRIRASLLLKICRQPGMDIEEISSCIDRSTKQAERHLKKLIANGLIHRQVDERKYRYYPGSATAQKLHA